MTDSGSGVYFRRQIPEEVAASHLAEKLGLCVAKSHYLPRGGPRANAWLDALEGSKRTTPDAAERVQFLFEDTAGVQEVEMIDGATVTGYQSGNYDQLLFDLGKMFAFDMFINDPNNCRHTGCSSKGLPDAHYWSCRDGGRKEGLGGGRLNLILSPDRGVCGYNRAFSSLDLQSDQGLVFTQFFQLAAATDTSTELAKQMAYVAGEMFGEHLTMDRRQVAELMLKGAHWTLRRLLQLSKEPVVDIARSAGASPSLVGEVSERLRLLKIADTANLPQFRTTHDTCGLLAIPRKSNAEQADDYSR